MALSDLHISQSLRVYLLTTSFNRKSFPRHLNTQELSKILPNTDKYSSNTDICFVCNCCCIASKLTTQKTAYSLGTCLQTDSIATVASRTTYKIYCYYCLACIRLRDVPKLNASCYAMGSFQPFILQKTLMMVYYAYFDSIMDMD
jgi:hypothetical protein